MLKIILPALALLLIPKKSTTMTWFTASTTLLFITFLMISKLYSPLTHMVHRSKLITLDSLRTPIIILTTWITSLIVLRRRIIINKNNSSRTFLLYTLSLNVILITRFSVNNLLLFYILFESSLIPTLMLILGWGYQPERLQAGLYLIIYTISASLPLLLIIILLIRTNLHLNMFYPLWIQPSQFTSMPQLLWLITTIAFLIKMPLYITHLWLPKAHVEAPVAGSIILAGILLKLGRYGLLRLYYLFQQTRQSISTPLTAIALWGGCVTRFICIRQTDIKSLIAYSSVGHIGLITAGIVTNSSWGIRGRLILIVAHGLCSSALFALANITYESTHSRNMFLSKGLITTFPILTLWWFLFAAANMAAPPSINLLREIILIRRIIRKSTLSLVPISVISFCAAAYSLVLFTSTQHGNTATFLNPLNLTKSINYSILSLHFVPLIIIILNPTLICL